MEVCAMKENKIKNTGLHLLKKGQKGIFHAVFSRFGIVFVLLAFQVALLFSVFFWFQSFVPQFFGGGAVFGLCVSFYILNTDSDASAKLTWIILVMALPVFGTLLYLYTEKEIGHRALRQRVADTIELSKDTIGQDPAVLESFKKSAPDAFPLARYLQKTGNFSVFNGTAVSYLSIGEDMFEEMLLQLEKARHFIFLEYFIIDEGVMWGKILEILSKKAQEGVDVRVMYDGTNEFTTLSRDYSKRLADLGIKTKVFSPLSPFVSTHYNYRDHRKIMVIDGHTAFTGGINFADRYINQEVIKSGIDLRTNLQDRIT